MKVSIAIPCWAMGGEGKNVLNHSFKILKTQSLKDFEVVVTDHSEDYGIKHVCDSFSKDFKIKYIRNEMQRGNPSNNTNLGLMNCGGEYIKLLCVDDYLLDETSLEHCYNDLKSSGNVWGFNSYFHTSDYVNLDRRHIPSFNNNIEMINTLGTPSALIIKNGLEIYMDETLKFYYDCEFYKRVYLKYGLPNISQNDTMVNYIHPNSTTNTIANNSLRNFEENYIRGIHKC